MRSACAELRDVYGGLNWIVRRVLDQCDALEMYFESVSQVEMPCWSRDRVVLIGDACQSVSPISGYGASMAVAAALILADELTRAADVSVALDLIRAPREAGRRTPATGGTPPGAVVPARRPVSPDDQERDHAHLDVADRGVGDPVANRGPEHLPPGDPFAMRRAVTAHQPTS